jgi:AcrR family transcriptional regulator
VAQTDNFYLEVLKTEPSSKDARRASLVKTVMEILAREGLDELTLERVGKRAGMARSHVVYYFKNRDSLIRAAVDCAALSAQTIIGRRVEQGGDAREKLLFYVEACFTWIETYPEHAAVYTLLYYLATLNKTYRDLHSTIRETGAKRIQTILASDKTRPGAKAARIARDIQALITGHLIDVTTTRNAKDHSSRMRETQRAVVRLLEDG